jgi:acyl-CoA synthetase (AMP-forming)/AMP-acid ligase II
MRIYDESFQEMSAGTVGRILVKNSAQFDGYTSGTTKDIHDGFISSGDLGRLDAPGRLFVVGRDDDQYGQRLTPSWCSPTGPAVTEDDLKADVRENLANYKVPREITILTELPRGSTGKILRNELLALLTPES